MIRVALRGLARPQAQSDTHRARDHPRRRDDERHLRPHGHDRQGVLDRSSTSRTPAPTSSSPVREPTSASRAPTPRAPPIDESLVDEVRALPDVEAADGQRRRRDEHEDHRLGREGDQHRAARRASASASTRPEVDRFNPLNLVEGNWAHGDGEVVIDAGTADERTTRSATRSRSRRLQPEQDFKLTGIAKFGDVDSLGTATFAVFDLPTAQRLLDREGQVDSISVAGTHGVDARAADQADPADAPAERTGAHRAPSRATRTSIGEFTKFIRYFLLAFAGIALFVGAFVIFNTLSITVAQRTREFATLRTVGASRRQVLWSVIVEALVDRDHRLGHRPLRRLRPGASA